MHRCVVEDLEIAEEGRTEEDEQIQDQLAVESKQETSADESLGRLPSTLDKPSWPSLSDLATSAPSRGLSPLS
jgi:hypothetical protein